MNFRKTHSAPKGRILISLYLVLSVLFVPFIFKLQQERYYNHINTRIESIIIHENDIEMELKQLYEKQPFEIMVYKNEEIIYSSLGVETITEAQTSLNTNAVGQSKIVKKDVNSNRYVYWLSIYLPSNHLFISTLLTIQMTLSLIIFVLSTISARKLKKDVLKPLQRIKGYLERIRDYDFSDAEMILQNDDIISEELLLFSNDLQKKIHNVQEQYLQLENKLIAHHENIRYNQMLITGIIHDMKAPIQGLLIAANQISKRTEDLYTLEKTNAIENISRETILQINTLNQYILNPKEKDLDQIETIHVCKEIMAELRLFQIQIQTKKINVELECDDQIHITMHRMAFIQLTKNAISNAVNYVQDDGDIIIKIQDQGNDIYFEFFNSSHFLDEQQLVDIFKLYKRMDNKEQNEFGSGIGLTIIATIIDRFGGTYQLYNDYQRKGICLSIRLPKDIEHVF